MRYLILILAATCCFAACKKEENTTPAPPADTTQANSKLTTVDQYNGHWHHYQRSGQTGVGFQESDTSFTGNVTLTRTPDSLFFEIQSFSNHNKYSFRKTDTTTFTAFKMYDGTMTLTFAGDSLYANYLFRSSGTGGGYAEDYRNFNGKL